MNYIIDHLYLGDWEDACDTDKLRDNGITHILTINSKPLYLEKREGFSYCHIEALDMIDQDLLRNIQQCITFIDDGREKGAVLVHCMAGQSRSATIVLAYVMSKLDLSLDEATRLVRKQRPQIKPNEGFTAQLRLFETMGNHVDTTHQEFKMYKLLDLAVKMRLAQNEDSLPEDTFSVDPSLGPAGDQTVYKCKKCRRPLFKKSAVLTHDIGRGDAAFDWRSRGTDDVTSGGAGGLCQQSLFIEPVQWMSGKILQLEGKICCPKCSAKLGSFDWTGDRCPCGTWVIPSFHIQTSKVDEARPRAAMPRIIAHRDRVAVPSGPLVASNSPLASTSSLAPPSGEACNAKDLSGEARSAGVPSDIRS